ncbi:ubiquitin carboxyl-terminal hydrolase 23 isoform X2 [Amborella trichopoda]|uniref:USP domain-containing protein n=1 Tax=Amborella trichopoda TaxID=13333 RepID=U5D8Z9_AMBTC|nr:ubiquitin carboxyl-terminal hydrolase 23 isoform X2 [Amborella trichopoda]ERN18690.1 hypothetical protein AMTR_s00065p00205690 [Amborella trichopoda]|eukprot:XP_006857223.1 ubiquitin carboxyl-terminal hydrolase 23 isoform X2 [Amborella trichopoda]
MAGFISNGDGSTHQSSHGDGFSMPSSINPLFQRRIAFHPARKAYSVSSNGDFHLEILNPSVEQQKPVSNMAMVPPVAKKLENSDHHELSLDPDLNLGIGFHRIGAGLANLGNTCFLNSVLQCLTYTEPLAAYLQSGKHKSSCHMAGFCAMCAIQNHVMSALRSSGKILSPNHLVRNLRCISRNFRNSRQEDAHEYMVNLMECMHKCCLPSGVLSESPGAYEKSLVHKIFGGRLQSQVKCTQCSHESNTFDPFLDLSLEIVKADSVRKALAHFTAREQLDGGEKQYQCDRCNKKVRAFKQLTIHKAPYVLTIHLKRFSPDGMGGKIDKMVQFGSNLELKPFVSGQYDVDLRYTLYGVLVHAGWSTHSGHYYCFIRTSSGIWHALDDNRVYQVSEKFVLQQKAYMLFYVLDRKRSLQRKLVDATHRENGLASAMEKKGLHASSLNANAKESMKIASKENGLASAMEKSLLHISLPKVNSDAKERLKSGSNENGLESAMERNPLHISPSNANSNARESTRIDNTESTQFTAGHLSIMAELNGPDCHAGSSSTVGAIEGNRFRASAENGNDNDSNHRDGSHMSEPAKSVKEANGRTSKGFSLEIANGDAKAQALTSNESHMSSKNNTPTPTMNGSLRTQAKTELVSEKEQHVHALRSPRLALENGIAKTETLASDGSHYSSSKNNTPAKNVSLRAQARSEHASIKEQDMCTLRSPRLDLDNGMAKTETLTSDGSNHSLSKNNTSTKNGSLQPKTNDEHVSVKEPDMGTLKRPHLDVANGIAETQLSESDGSHHMPSKNSPAANGSIQAQGSSSTCFETKSNSPGKEGLKRKKCSSYPIIKGTSKSLFLASLRPHKKKSRKKTKRLKKDIKSSTQDDFVGDDERRETCMNAAERDERGPPNSANGSCHNGMKQKRGLGVVNDAKSSNDKHVKVKDGGVERLHQKNGMLAMEQTDNSKKRGLVQTSSTTLLATALSETTVGRWDGVETESPEIDRVIETRKTGIGYILDEWDEEYDRGKRKKLRNRELGLGENGANPFQDLYTKKTQPKPTKLRRNRSGNQPMRI